MSESDRPFGDQGNAGNPGGGYPGQDSTRYGYEQGRPATPHAGQGGQVPSAPQFGSPSGYPSAQPTSASSAPPASAGSAAPSPWAASAPSAAGAPDGSGAPSGAQGAQAVSAAQVGATLGKIGIGNPLPTFAVGAIAYVVALVASLVVIASAFIASLSLDTGDLTGGADPTGGAGSSGGGGGAEVILGLLGLPFQLVSLATFGSYEMELNLGFLGTATMSLRGMPLLITLAMVLAAFLAARFTQRRWGSNGVLGALVWSGISGLAVAIFAVIVVRLTAFSVQDDELGLSVSMHSAGFDMFLGTWFLIGMPLFLGHLAGMTKPSWWPMVADLAAAPRLAIVHALTFALPVGVLAMLGGAIGMMAEGDGRSALSLLLALPVWGPTALALLPGLGMLVVPVHMNAQGSVEELGMERTAEFLWFFDLPWYLWIPMVLIALVVPLIIAVLWNRDREIAKGDIAAQVVSWAALPLAYGTCSIILLALVWTSMSMEMAFLGNLTVNFGLAAWMPVVAFFLGAVIEAISRFGAPFVDRFVPGVLVNWFRRSARARRTEQASAADAAAPSEDPASPYGEASPYGQGPASGTGW